MSRQPVITGLGVIASPGYGVETMWNAIASQRDGLKPLTLFPSPRHGPEPVGEVQLDLLQLGAPRSASRSDRLGWLAALLCYPPFVMMGTGALLTYEVNTQDWSVWFAGNYALLWIWGSLLVFLTAIYGCDQDDARRQHRQGADVRATELTPRTHRPPPRARRTITASTMMPAARYCHSWRSPLSRA